MLQRTLLILLLEIRKMRLLSTLSSREIKNLTHDTNRNSLFKNNLSLSDLYESHKRKADPIKANRCFAWIRTIFMIAAENKLRI